MVDAPATCRQVVALRERGETTCAHVVELLQRRATEIEQSITEMGTCETSCAAHLRIQAEFERLFLREC